MISSLCILGSTGSIGRQTLDLCLYHGIPVTGLSCGGNLPLFKEQIARVRPRAVAVEEEEAADLLRDWLKQEGLTCTLYGGKGASVRLAEADDAEMLLNAISGMAGLAPSFAAVRSGHDLALANKESLVGAGTQLLTLIRSKGGRLLPVDSEHSAVWQCLEGFQKKGLKKIFLTCSGGPFRLKSAEELRTVKAAEALCHPTWSMGRKITIDSSTLMNKGLEWIEAVHLFSLTPEQIEVVIHPESIVHSAVLFEDGACIAQLGNADMRLPIQYALCVGERRRGPMADFSFFAQRGGLHFEAVNHDLFPLLNMAVEAFQKGLYFPLVMNAANEIAVEAFLNDEISYLSIASLIRECLNLYEEEAEERFLEVNEILNLDRRWRQIASARKSTYLLR